MDITVDAGPNITSMLERLAQQIGTTADMVFPWYVNQAHLEGITTLIGLGIAWSLFICLISIGLWKGDFEKGNRYATITVISCVLGFFTLVGSAFEGADAARKIMNPNYYAVKMLTYDLGRLTRK